MNNRTRVLTAVLGLTLLVSLTLACSLPGLPDLGGLLTQEETPTPAPAEDTPVGEVRCGDGVCDDTENPQNCPQDCEAPEPPAPPEQLPFELDVEALQNLSSYAYTLHIDGLSTLEGTTEDFVLDIEGQRQSQPTKAEQLSFSSVSEGESTGMEIIYIEEVGKMWIREAGDAWQEVPVMDESMLDIFDMFSMFYWWEIFFTGDPEDAQYLGQEMMNGVQAHHYRTMEGAAWGAFTAGCTFGSVQDDVWVAVDGSFPVKRQFDAVGECQGESGEVLFLMEIRNVNQPVSISPPE